MTKHCLVCDSTAHNTTECPTCGCEICPNDPLTPCDPEKIRQLKDLVKVMQIETARARWYAVKIKCMMQDINLLLDGILQNKDPNDVGPKLMYQPTEDTNKWEDHPDYNDHERNKRDEREGALNDMAEGRRKA